MVRRNQCTGLMLWFILKILSGSLRLDGGQGSASGGGPLPMNQHEVKLHDGDGVFLPVLCGEGGATGAVGSVLSNP